MLHPCLISQVSMNHPWLKAMRQMSRPDTLLGFSGQGLANVSSRGDEVRISYHRLKWLQLWRGNIQQETTAFGNYHRKVPE